MALPLFRIKNIKGKHLPSPRRRAMLAMLAAEGVDEDELKSILEARQRPTGPQPEGPEPQPSQAWPRQAPDAQGGGTEAEPPREGVARCRTPPGRVLWNRPPQRVWYLYPDPRSGFTWDK